MSAYADNIVKRRSTEFFCFNSQSGLAGYLWVFGKFLRFLQKMTQLWPRKSVDVSMKKIGSLQKLAGTKKDARLTIRIPKELKIRIDGIDEIYGVALPKIANECLKAFCDYVEQRKQTPTFPLSIGPYLPGAKTPDNASVRRRRGFQDGHPQRA
jgi:hypothetical protein